MKIIVYHFLFVVSVQPFLLILLKPSLMHGDLYLELRIIVKSETN